MRKWLLVCLVMAVMTAGTARHAEASDFMCFTEYVRCNYRAAAESSFWMRTFMALDCELNLWSCIRSALGY